MFRFRKANTLVALLIGVLVLYMEIDYKRSMKVPEPEKSVR